MVAEDVGSPIFPGWFTEGSAADVSPTLHNAGWVGWVEERGEQGRVRR